MGENSGTGRVAVLALVVFASGLTVLAYFGAPRARIRPQSPPRRPVLAVLPFENLSGEPALEVLASEITAKITSVLSRRDEIEVVPRAKSLEFKGVPGGLEAVNESLGADYVITGSLDVSGEGLKVDAYLYRAGPDPALWAERIEWSAKDTEALPEELARRIDAAVRERDRPMTTPRPRS